ncbi:MAG: LysM peptidoglycan-binding domain-containing protein, partial [Actinobacteria bacterium]|nr:LysM peptidoglycan-binding domain-containing protein [Actinomycetota bacterium]
LSGIAARYGTTVTALMTANGLTSTTIYAGARLTVPGAAPAATAPAAPKPAPKPATPTPTPATTHTVVRGDTLSGIAARHGTTVATLMSTNSLTSTVIFPGQVLRVTATPTTPAGTPQLVPSTFLHYTYPAATVSAANANKAALLASGVPSREAMRTMVRSTATSMGVNPALAMAIAMKESGFNHASVSPANAIGTMQVIPSSGVWASDLVGRKLNLLDPQDNVTAGVAIIRQLVRSSSSLDIAIASYYQGAASVRRNGMYSDTRSYVAGVKAYMTQFGG